MITVDNISKETLDKLVELYKDKKGFRINDDRETLIGGKPREYFLIGYENREVSGVEFTFIWIGSNLWQFRYCNIHCGTEANWKNPQELLNELLKGNYGN